MIKIKPTPKQRAKVITVQVILHIFVWLFVALTLFPLLITLMFSLKSAADFQRGMWAFPTVPQFSNYAHSLKIMNVNMLNSIFCSLLICFGSVFVASFSAFIFSRFEFPFKNFLFSLILALMMVPGVLTLTSSYLNIQQLHLYNSRFAVILPGIASNLVGSIFLFRTFMGQHPADLYESAQIDGANEWTMYWRICLPLSVPVLMIQLIGIFAGQYNDYLWPRLVIEDNKKQMLMPLLKDLANDLSTRYSNEGLSYALYICSGIPLIITSSIGLKYCINGDFASGMKL